MSKRWTEEDLKKLPAHMLNASPMSRIIPVIGSNIPDKPQNIPSIQAIGTVRDRNMNKTEARFAQQLELQKSAGALLWWDYEPMNLRLGINCYYRIDFMVMEKSGRLVAYEVKGKWEDDALVKIRTAAEKFPWPFIAVRWKRKEKEWEYRHF